MAGMIVGQRDWDSPEAWSAMKELFALQLTKDSSCWNPSCLNSNTGSLVPHKAGFISVLGRPNVGKSTLFNSILGEKIAIVSEKPQTTRNRILGIRNMEGGQLLFLDTPGIHHGKSKLNQRMVSTAIESGRDVDVLLFLIDASSPLLEEDRQMVGSLEGEQGSSLPRHQQD